MPPRAKTRDLREALLIISLSALALVVRLPGIEASFYGDEGFSLLRDSKYWLTPSEDRFRPLYFSLLFFWRQLGFHGEFGLRGLSLAFGVLQIPVAFKLGEVLQGRRAAVVFCLLLAFNPLLIEFSQELRMYSLVPLIALLQAWAFAEAARRSQSGHSTLGCWVGFVLAGVAGVYTHFHYWFLIAGFGVAALRRRRELPLRQSLAALAAIGLSYVPDIPNLLRFQREAGGGPHLLATDLPSALPKLVASFFVGFNFFTLPSMGLDRAIRAPVIAVNLGLALLAAVAAGLVLWQLARLLLQRRIEPAFALSLELFVTPALLSFIAVALTHRDFIHPKYMVFAAPFFSLLLAAGYLAMPGRLTRILAALSFAAVFAVAIEHFNEPHQYGRREDWRGAAEFLRSHLNDRSVLLTLGDQKSPERPFVSASPASLWEYYGADLFARTRIVHVESVAPEANALETVKRLSSGAQAVYYLWSEVDRNFNDPGDVLLGAARKAFTGEQRLPLNPRMVVYQWQTQ